MDELDTREPDGPEPRVTLGFGALLVGLVVAVAILAAAMGLSWALSGNDFLGTFTLALVYGLPIGIVTGFPLGAGLSLTLRRVRNQWLHVLAFFVVFTAAGFVGIALVSVSGTAQNLPLAVVVGGAAAIARWSVWRMARIQ
ncbi:hypothetical protein [Arthrobacter sp. Br18]|uniref:hypothetical protein n=1 Tax=Arthrobacter sp. Br18 TaxID=1312954 RepID=UPI00047E9CD5|nr:hypothetical protein [Arthrobacter sp. Br18]